MSSRYLLDTNMASYIIKGTHHQQIDAKLQKLGLDKILLSSITVAELTYGLCKRGHPKNLTNLVLNFIQHVRVLSWGAETAQCYGKLRADLEAKGITLDCKDMFITAHAVEANAILVTHDDAIKLAATKVKSLRVEDWC
jgi:tRNA(fMet)-specific endonuclease VapC